MTYKKVSQVPVETQRINHDDIVTHYIASLLNYAPSQMHFFDEASVDTTAGNRTYGHSSRGKRAHEIQRYASNLKLTVNACCGYFGLDYYDVIQGPSNAMEMVNYFDEALRQTNDLGNPVFSVGDVLIMDNCVVSPSSTL
ncbi:uncharacterized protein, partial [Argopecten irradians]|uniref:uncharacterized protein n=1 Tax=Argopecten irradians TaxID=31199 RepID=UPI00371CB458